MGELSPLNLIAGSAFGHIDSLTISDSTIYGWLKNTFWIVKMVQLPHLATESGASISNSASWSSRTTPRVTEGGLGLVDKMMMRETIR
jgi:hypothetical protein